MEKINELKQLLGSMEADVDKFYNKSNMAAGKRIRKGLQELKAVAQAIRLEIQEVKNKEA